MRAITFILTFTLITFFSFSQEYDTQEYYKLDSNGVIHGAYILKCNDKVLAKGYFHKGNPAGKWEFYNYEGNKIVEGYYLNGRMNGQWTHYKNNKVISKTGYRLGILHGKTNSYYPNGNFRITINYENGMIDDTLTVFDYNSAEKIKAVFERNKPVSILKTSVVDNFALSFKGNLLNGNGKYVLLKRWSGNMVPVEERNYKEGKLNGKYVSYENGSQYVVGDIENDFLVEKWKFNINSSSAVKKIFELSDSVNFNTLGSYIKNISDYDFTHGVYFIVDEMPKFLGQEVSRKTNSGIYFSETTDVENMTTPFDSYIYSELKKLEIRSKGNVFVKFTVGLLGEVKDVHIAGGRGLNDSENEKILTLFKNLPYFEPGYYDGFPVNVQYVKPLNFN
jgi:antitoxin component YwqK of YwqJK toxin-antitoxin module